MLSAITLAEIPANNVVHDYYTRLFPFSPRREVDPHLVERLKRSIAETGMWQPIVVRAGTMEGIAGNHRYLACLEFAQEAGLDRDTLTISAVLVDCDEGLAVSIALAENELRENLTQWETVRALLRAAECKPKVVETVFEVDGQTVEQLRLWEEELDYEAEMEERRRVLQARLTRQWLSLINERLSEHPELRAQFLEQLRHPTWVQARTLDELDRAITRALLNHGVRFETGRTWNDAPTPTCLGCQMTFEELCEALRRGDDDVALQHDGTITGFCCYLRLFPRYTPQFVPGAQGTAVLEVNDGDDVDRFPLETLAPDGRGVRGDDVLLVDGVDAYCVAPDIHEPGSCFRQREAETAQAMVQALVQQGLSAVLPVFVQEREGIGDFVWRCPQREGTACTPETCAHAQDEPPGFVAVAQPGSTWEMVCVHAECGGAAQEALVDWEAQERRRERQRQQVALDALRQVSVARTLLAPPAKAIELSSRAFLEAIEPVLVPAWDDQTMAHVVLGWQAATREQIAVELGEADPATRTVSRAFRDRHSELADKPTGDSVPALFAALRERMSQTDEGLRRWITCLALVRTWRDEVGTMEQIAEATEKIASYE